MLNFGKTCGTTKIKMHVCNNKLYNIKETKKRSAKCTREKSSFSSLSKDCVFLIKKAMAISRTIEIPKLA